jgi:hypothetical protein
MDSGLPILKRQYNLHFHFPMNFLIEGSEIGAWFERKGFGGTGTMSSMDQRATTCLDTKEGVSSRWEHMKRHFRPQRLPGICAENKRSSHWIASLTTLGTACASSDLSGTASSDRNLCALSISCANSSCHLCECFAPVQCF